MKKYMIIVCGVLASVGLLECASGANGVQEGTGRRSLETRALHTEQSVTRSGLEQTSLDALSREAYRRRKLVAAVRRRSAGIQQRSLSHIPERLIAPLVNPPVNRLIPVGHEPQYPRPPLGPVGSQAEREHIMNELHREELQQRWMREWQRRASIARS